MKTITALKQLEYYLISLEAIPPGGNYLDGVRFLLDHHALKETAIVAKEKALEMIGIVRAAPEPNPWKAASDEEIAVEILRRVEAKRQTRHR